MEPSKLNTLNDQYKEHLARYDKGAVQRKWARQFVWMTITSLTWLTLLVSIIGVTLEEYALQLDPDLVKSWVTTIKHLISVFGVLVIGLTVAQTTFGLQGKWLAYRAAAENLRRTCMLFRCGLPPFNGPDAEQVLERAIADINDVADHPRVPRFKNFFTWDYLRDLLVMPPDLKRSFPNTPEQGLNVGPIVKEEEVLDGRLRNQRQWYLRKSQRYALRYLVFQVAIVLCSVINILHVLILGRILWIVAITTTVSLGLMACRDFLDWGPLFLRYRQTADNLKEIEQAYLGRKPPFDSGDAGELRRRLAEQVEATLSSEFQYWYVTRR
jgi:hypothetical protein